MAPLHGVFLNPLFKVTLVELFVVYFLYKVLVLQAACFSAPCSAIVLSPVDSGRCPLPVSR